MKACFDSVAQTAKHTHCFFFLWKDVRRVCDVPGGHKSMPRVCVKPDCGDGMWECVPSCDRKPNGCDQNVTNLFGKM